MKMYVHVLSVLLIGSGLVINATANVGDQNSVAASAKSAKSMHAMGSVVSTDIVGNTLTVKGKGKKKPEWVFSVPANAKITEGKKVITLGDVTAGSRVAVKYTKDGDTLNASSIQVVHVKK